MKTLTFQVSEETFRCLKRLAKELDLTLPEVAKEIIDGGAESAEEIILCGGVKACLARRPVIKKEPDFEDGIPRGLQKGLQRQIQ